MSRLYKLQAKANTHPSQNVRLNHRNVLIHCLYAFYDRRQHWLAYGRKLRRRGYRKASRPYQLWVYEIQKDGF